MDTSRRAVESYWRSRLIDGVTSDEDKVAPVYKLEEICELLRSSHVSIVKEVSEFILKRLDHKSPIVKQKALRLIKYSVGKSGVEFRREMQRHSVAVRQLFHYKGQPDPLKGDALNKAVRDTAHEAISAIFSEENKPAAPADNLNRRIQGFGNTNFEMQSDDKKSFLSEVVGIGSASIKQGLSNFAQGNSLRKNDNGSYKSPHLHRSLTRENEYGDRYESVEYRSETQGSSGLSKSGSSSWSQDARLAKAEMINGNPISKHTESKTPEERLLDTIVTTGGVRIQPTRDAIQVFLGEAAKLDAVTLSLALESKLQSPMWQVRMKAVCVLESMLRKKDDEHFSVVATYFGENKDVVLKCSESPQSSLREKANKVLSLLGGEQTGSSTSTSDKTTKAVAVSAVQMPDLIDTGDAYDYNGTVDSNNKPSEQTMANLTAPPPLIDDLFGDDSSHAGSTTELKNDDDPFADVSFHTNESKMHLDDLFSGKAVDGKQNASENHIAGNTNGPELFDIFGSNSGVQQQVENHETDVNDLMGGLSIDENGSKMKQTSSSSTLSESLFSDSTSQPSHQAPYDALSGILGSQAAGMNTNAMFPQGAVPYNIPPGLMFNQAFPSQQINYAAMSNLLAQQLATMSNLQQIGHLTAQNTGVSHSLGTGTIGGYSSALPDVFQPNFPSPAPNSAVNTTKKEDTKAFDFISDHLAAARDPKRLV